MGKKSFCPPPTPQLKRNKSKASWAFPLAERKINPPPPPPNLKGKKPRHPESMMGLPIGWMKFLFAKQFITIFRLG
jgi:hypothetical protein